MSFRRAVDSISRGGAVLRLPNKLFLRQAGLQPKYVMRFYLMLFALFVPTYFVNWAISEVSTWFGCVLLWGSLVWTLGHKVAMAIVFPGCLRMTSRSVEEGIAYFLKQRVDNIAKEVITFSRHEQAVFPLSISTAITRTIAPLAETVKQHVTSHNLGPKAIGCSEALAKFCSAVEEWKQNHKDAELRKQVTAAGEALLDVTNRFMDCREDSAKSKSGKRVSPLTGEEEEEPEDLEATLEDRSTVGSRDLEAGSHVADEDVEDTVFDEQLERSRVVKLAKVNMWVMAWTSLTVQIDNYMATRRSYIGMTSFSFMRKHLENWLGGQVQMVNSDGYNIDTCFFKWNEAAPGADERRAVVMCNPNAGRYEHCVWNPFWVQFYRERGNAVLVWNYRGYGRSEGEPSPNNLRKDVETLVRHLRRERGCSKIVLHGESIGGIAACHAMANCEDLAEGSLLICDRTFASLHRVAASLVSAPLANLMHLFTGWIADSDVNFLIGASTRNRLILQDAHDEIVHHDASLKVGVAERLFDRLGVISRDQVEAFYSACDRFVGFFQRARAEQMKQTSDVDSLVRIYKTLMRLDGGHGQAFQDAFTQEAQKREAKEIYARSKLGKATTAVAKVTERLRQQRAGRPEQNFFYDWFACAFVFGIGALNYKAFEEVLGSIEVALTKQSAEEMTRILEDMRDFLRAYQAQLRASDAGEGEWGEKAKQLLRGIVVPLNCGHNGSPSQYDINKVEQYLRKGGFVGANLAPEQTAPAPALRSYE